MRAEIVVPGTRLFACTDGTAGDWVVLSHCLATDHTMWEPQVAALATRYRVLRYDTRGHGLSAVPHAPYSMNQLAGDVAAILDHFQIPRAHLVGLSLGGEVVAAAALRHPSRVISATICDSRMLLPPGAPAMMDERIRLVREQGIEAIIEPMIQRWFTPASLAAKLPAIEAVRGMMRNCAAEGFAGCTEAIKTGNLPARLGQIKAPTLFLVGDADAAVPTAVMKEQQALVPGAAYAEIAGAGHLSNLERPEAFNDALLGFLGGVA